jgi:hypothetical protein
MSIRTAVDDDDDDEEKNLIGDVTETLVVQLPPIVNPNLEGNKQAEVQQEGELHLPATLQNADRENKQLDNNVNEDVFSKTQLILIVLILITAVLIVAIPKILIVNK